eukprot:g29701.t1
MLVLDLLTTLLPVELMTATKSIKMEEEFRTAGYSSLLAGLLWGNVSYISLSPTRLNHDAGGVSRESGLLSAGLCILWIFVGPELTGYVPKFVVGGMLCHLAFGYILEGLWDPRSLLSIGEYLIIVAMICYYLITDLAPAIFLGLALCSFSFILRYSQSSNLEFVKVAGEADMFSNRFRSAVDQHYLKSSRSIVVVRSFCSQLFFGTMASILAEVEPFLHDARFLLLDLSSLRTIDSSGLVGFQKIPPQIQTVLVRLSPELQAQVRRAGLAVCMFGSIDEGLEWCEDRTLKFRYLDDSDLSSLLLAPTSNNPSVRSAVLRAFGDELLELEPLLLQLPVKKHEVVFHEGSLAEGLYIVVSGTLQIQYGNQRGIVLGPGLAGQIWSLVANVASILLLLRRDKLLLAEQRHPQAAIALHRCLMMSQLQKSGLWQGNTAFLRLGMPCRTLQEGLAARCLQPELAGLTSDVLLKLLGCVPLEARAACEALGAELAGHIEELDHPRRLVQAVEAMAKVRLAEEKLLKPLGSQIIYFMVDFSSKDVARTAMACQKLMVQDGAVLEALVRQANPWKLPTGGFRLKAPQIEAVVAACHAAGFEHPMLVELLEGLQQQKQKQSEKEQAAAAAAAAAPQEGQSDWDSVEETGISSNWFQHSQSCFCGV